MRKATSLVVVLVLALGLVGFYTASSSADDEETLKVVEKITSFNVVDNDPQGESPGDFVVLTADLFKNKSGKAGSKIGTGLGQCTVIEANIEGGRFILKCFVTWSLKDGTLELAAVLNEATPEPHTFDIAVIGGTGDFRKARGDGKAKELSEGETAITLKIS